MKFFSNRVESIIFTFEMFKKQEPIIEVCNFLKVIEYDFHKNLQKQTLYIYCITSSTITLVLLPLLKNIFSWICYKVILSNSVGKSIFSSSLKNFWNKHFLSSEEQKFIGKKIDKKTFRHSSTETMTTMRFQGSIFFYSY